MNDCTPPVSGFRVRAQFLRGFRARVCASALGFLGACASNPNKVAVPANGAPAPATTDAGTVADAATVAKDAGAFTTSAAEPPEQRADEILAQMTAEEKFDYIGGDRSLYIRAIPRLGVPEIKMSDGPAGCRHWGPSTAYPAAVALAATFDVAAAEKMGAAIGRDCRERGVHILLAPGVNIQRSPLDGRNFEYMGEDPLLAGKTAAGYIRGVQSEGVLATVKHFAGNNQEWDRSHVSSDIDERTLREIYFPAFERAVREGHVSAVMTAYNLLNGVYCSHDSWLLHDVLEHQWGFRGIVMSDWSATHDTLAAARGGLDLEMPFGKFMNRETLPPLLAAHKLDIAVIDDKVRRILRTIIAAGFLDRAQKRDDLPASDPATAAVALEIARESIVLLKNQGALLPLDRGHVKRIAVIGPNAEPAVVGGHGSAFVTPNRTTSLLAGIRESAAGITIDYHPGVQQPSEFKVLGTACFAGPVQEEVFSGRDLAGGAVQTDKVDRIDVRRETSAPAPNLGDAYSIRWSGEVKVDRAGSYKTIANSEGGVRVLVDGKAVIDNWKDHPTATDSATLDLKPGRHAVVVEYYRGADLAVAQFGFALETRDAPFEGGAEVSALARRADVVVLSIGFGQGADTNSAKAAFAGRWPPAWARKKGLVEAEDSDRPFELPAAQLETIRLAAAANPHTVVVINAGAGVDMQKFASKVPAVLWAFYPGQDGGRAVADILFGDANPSGKLPFTIAKRYADYPSAPYYNVDKDKKTPYTEGVFVGYRGFDASAIEPQYPFGYGMSYTSFAYSDLRAEAAADGSATVRVKVTNGGARAGDEVVEVYVAPPKASAPRPPKELKGFARVTLAPGESKEVTIALEPRAFAFWNDHEKRWSVEPGQFEILAGASSRDIRLKTTLAVAASSPAL